MKSYWKTPPIKLSDKEYSEMRLKLYDDQHQLCHICGMWMEFDRMSFHHTYTGGMGMKGNDVDEDGKPQGFGCHIGCHPD